MIAQLRKHEHQREELGVELADLRWNVQDHPTISVSYNHISFIRSRFLPNNLDHAKPMFVDFYLGVKASHSNVKMGLG